jgi:zinc transport system substrate-binding protein
MRLLCLAVVCTIAICGCIDQSDPVRQTDGKLRVVATIFPLYDMARYVGGENAQVTLLIPAGSEIHSFEPTPDKVARLSSADMLIINGMGLEPWAPKLLSAASNRDIVLVDASEGITPMGSDPHVFQDPVLAKKQLENIVTAFILRDPENKAAYRRLAAEYEGRLILLDNDYSGHLKNCSTRTVLLNHGFLGYAAKRYGFEQISLSGLSPESEPRPGDFKQAVEAARTHNAGYVLYESTVSPKNALTIAREANLTAAGIRSAHEISTEDFNLGKTYPDILADDLTTLEMAMRCII